MQADITLIRKALFTELMEIMIRFSLIAFLVVMSVKVFSPFLALILWAVILAVILYPLHQRAAKRLGALGGMVSAGLIGLFVGATFLALGYVVFMNWAADGEAEDNGPADEDINNSVAASE